jgi:hypothetical protein
MLGHRARVGSVEPADEAMNDHESTGVKSPHDADASTSTEPEHQRHDLVPCDSCGNHHPPARLVDRHAGDLCPACDDYTPEVPGYQGESA